MSDPNPNPSKLDPNQIAQAAFDDDSQRIRVDAEITAIVIQPQEVIITDVDDSIRIGSGGPGPYLVVNSDGSITAMSNLSDGSGNPISSTSGSLNVQITNTSVPVTVGSIALPTGASTSAKQDVGNASLASIDGKITAVNTGAVVVASSALPTGAATAALQTQPGVDIGDVTVNNASGAGSVNIQDGGNSITVDGTVAATQSGTWNVTNVSGTVSLPTGASTSALQTTGNTSLSSIDTKTPALGQAVMASSTPVVIASNQSAVSISGTVTANAGTNLNTSALALDSTLTGGTQQSKITDGTNVASVKAASTAAVATDKALVVAISPNNTIPVSGSITVSGTVTANAGTNLNTSALALESGGNLSSIKADVDNLNLSQGSTTSGQKGNLGLGAVTTAAPTYSTTQSSPLSLNTAGGLRVDGSGVTQPVSGTVTVTQGTGTNLHTVVDSGTVTANIGTTNGLALDATLTGGTQQSKITDGTNVASVKAASTAAIATDKALVVAVSPNNSVAVTGTFFQATQPVSGTVAATQSGTWNITNVSGTVSLPTGASTAAKQPALGTAGTPSVDIITVQGVTSMTPLKVDGSGAVQPVSGTVTANAGTGTFTVGQATGTNLHTVVDSGSITVTQATAANLNATVIGTVTANAGTNLNTSTLALESGGNLTSIKTDVDNLNLAQGSTTSGQKGNLNLGAVTTAAPTYTTGQSNSLSLTTTGALRTDGSGTTQPVSGTVTSNIGTTNGLALDATLTGGTQQSKITDGTNVATVKAASTAAIATDKALVVAISPNNSLTVSNSANGNTGSAVPTQATQVGGSDGTNLRALKTSTTGVLVTSGLVDPNNIFSPTNQPSGDAGPILIAGAAGTGAGTFAKVPLSMKTVGTDGNGNTIWGLPVFDYSQGASNTFSVSLTNGSGNSDWSPTGNSMFIDVSNTWTGSISLQQQYDIAHPTVSVRQLGTGTVVSSITANGSYVVEGEFNGDLIFVNSIATGTADIFAVSTAGYTSGAYAHQAGTWNVTNVSGTVSLPTGASTSALQTTGNSSLSSIDTKTPALGQAVMASSRPVVIASNQSAVPVSGTVTANAGTGNFTVTQATGTNLHTVVDSGTVTANIGTTNGLALDATLTGGTQQTKITDGTNVATVKAASTAAVATDKAVVVAISPNNTVAATQSGNWSVRSQDGAGTALTSTLVGSKQSIDVNVSRQATPTDNSGSGTIIALNGTVVGTTNGCSSITFDVTGTWVATISIEATIGDGNWFGINGDVDTTDAITSTFTTNTFITIPCGGFSQVRLNATLFTSGTVNVSWVASLGSNILEIFNTTANSLKASVNLNDGAGTSVTVGQKTSASSLPVVIASDQSAVSVVGPTLTKGTQGSTGFSTQDLKDAGRTAVNFWANAAATGTTTTETAITLTKSSGTAANTTAASFVVPSGKRFRITHLSVATRGNAVATAQSTVFNLRINTGGAVTTTSTPIVFSAQSATAAVASAWDRYIIPIPDGFEILGDGTLQFGITAAATFITTAPTWSVNIMGFEY